MKTISKNSGFTLLGIIIAVVIVIALAAVSTGIVKRNGRKAENVNVDPPSFSQALEYVCDDYATIKAAGAYGETADLERDRHMSRCRNCALNVMVSKRVSEDQLLEKLDASCSKLTDDVAWAACVQKTFSSGGMQCK